MLDNQPHGAQEVISVRLEVCVLSVVDKVLCACLQRNIRRSLLGRWALPGGRLRIDQDAELTSGVRRIAREVLGIELYSLRQLGAVGSADRDPHSAYGLSVLYRALLPKGKLLKDFKESSTDHCWMQVDEPCPEGLVLPDHLQWISQAVNSTRTEIEELRFPPDLLPREFTLSELQTTCEEILGRSIDKSSFRRKLNDRQIVEPLTGSVVSGMAYRPAQIYRLR